MKRKKTIETERNCFKTAYEMEQIKNIQLEKDLAFYKSVYELELEINKHLSALLTLANKSRGF